MAMRTRWENPEHGSRTKRPALAVVFGLWAVMAMPVLAQTPTSLKLVVGESASLRIVDPGQPKLLPAKSSGSSRSPWLLAPRGVVANRSIRLRIAISPEISATAASNRVRRLAPPSRGQLWPQPRGILAASYQAKLPRSRPKAKRSSSPVKRLPPPKPARR